MDIQIEGGDLFYYVVLEPEHGAHVCILGKCFVSEKDLQVKVHIIKFKSKSYFIELL